MLYANPTLKVQSFDLFAFNYSKPISRLLRTHFGARFNTHRGDSTETVPEWTRAQPHQCHFAFVDGDHQQIGALRDMINFRYAALAGADIVADDINSAPGTALAMLQTLGQVKVVEAYGPFDAPHQFSPCMSRVFGRNPVCGSWGFAVFRYVDDPPKFAELDALREMSGLSSKDTIVRAFYRLNRVMTAVAMGANASLSKAPHAPHGRAAKVQQYGQAR